MKKTFKQLQEIDQVVGGLYAKNPELRETKFGYSYKRFSDKNYMPVVRDYQESLGDIRADAALTDKDTGALLLDKENPRGYKFDSKGDKKIRQAERKLTEEWDEKEFDITPFYVKVEDLPKNMNEFQTEVLMGSLIEPKSKGGKAGVN